MTAPGATVCQRCDGEGLFTGYDRPADTIYQWWPCPDCCCERCGQTTPTAPLCEDCADDIADKAYERGADR